VRISIVLCIAWHSQYEGVSTRDSFLIVFSFSVVVVSASSEVRHFLIKTPIGTDSEVEHLSDGYFGKSECLPKLRVFLCRKNIATDSECGHPWHRRLTFLGRCCLLKVNRVFGSRPVGLDSILSSTVQNLFASESRKDAVVLLVHGCLHCGSFHQFSVCSGRYPAGSRHRPRLKVET
jgi:hypothetical protein